MPSSQWSFPCRYGLTWGFVAIFIVAAVRADDGPKLVAHWPLRQDARDVVGSLHGQAEAVVFGQNGATFNGRDARIQVPSADTLIFGTRDFSIAAWVRCKRPMSSTLGDILSKFDPAMRRGINLHVAGSSPAYSAMSDARHVHFGIDDGYLGEWIDHGKPWPSNSLVSNLVAYRGTLFCGIADADRPEDRAHVFRLRGDNEWVDCGRLGTDANHHSVMSLLVHDGQLYAGTGIWDWVQALGGLKGAPAPAATRVFRYEGGTTWRDLGQVGHGSRVLCLASFQGELFAGLDRIGAGRAFKYNGREWIDCGAPDGKNLECFLPWGGTLFAATHGNIYVYRGGQEWRSIGTAPHDINQIHSMQAFGGKVLLGTWSQGYVLRHRADNDWEKIGRLGLPEGSKPINEVMDLTVYNGKLYAGLIPKAEVYRYERDGDWTRLGSLAKHPDWSEEAVETWARVTCLSFFRGRLFAGTGSCQGRALDAPADSSLGRVFSIQAGQVVSHEHDIGGDWTHITATRRGRRLELFINGQKTESAELRAGPAFNINNAAPLWIGFGSQNFFDGQIADLRWYDGPLDAAAIQKLSAREKSSVK